jgi:hypothetical protein
MNLQSLAVAWLGVEEDRPIIRVIVYGIGVLGITIFGNTFYDLLRGDTKMLWIPSTAFLILLLISAVLLDFYRKNRMRAIRLIENPKITAKSAIVTSLSPYQSLSSGSDNLDVIRKIIDLHGSKLTTLHFISVLAQSPSGDIYVTHEDKDKSRSSVKVAWQTLKNEGLLKGIQCQYHPIEDTASAEENFKIVYSILENYSTNDVLVDVTAGSKAMSVGLAAAAFAHNCAIEYQATDRDDHGQPILGKMRPVVLENGKLRTHILRRAYTSQRGES